MGCNHQYSWFSSSLVYVLGLILETLLKLESEINIFNKIIIFNNTDNNSKIILLNI